jgi:sugar transferase EpsL
MIPCSNPGRNAITWEEKLKLDVDVWYVDHHTLCLDIRILFMTLVKVFHREGISAAGEAIMGEFKGSVNG